MAWVYMLRGSPGRFYIGSTTDLDRRVKQHQSGHTHTTQRLGADLEVVASLQLQTLEAARALEREMKRKKNPQLALYLLEQARSKSSH
jgi:putative endonuclease